MFLKETRVTINCNKCNWEAKFEVPFSMEDYFWLESEHIFTKCPYCHNNDTKITREEQTIWEEDL